jgi:O-antigen/teichoic acid export membrane protein
MREGTSLTATVGQLEANRCDPQYLTSGSRLATNTLWNLIGNVAPMLVAIFCIPVLVKALGTNRFGILTLVWALIGYSTVFDFGLGRALTQLVATRLGTDEQEDVPDLVWTSQLMMLFLGFVGTAVLGLLSGWLARHVLHVPVGLEGETTRSLYLLAFSIPIVISTAGLRGLLEAHQQFGVTNALRLPTGVFTFVAPLLVLPFSNSLVPVVAILLGGRLLTWVAHLLYCAKIVPDLRHRISWRHDAIRPLLQFGGWMTVSNVVGPLMVTLDRFVIAALVSVAAVAYYATPLDVITKLWLVPAALLGVMFPAFTMTFVRDRARTRTLYERSVKLLLFCLFPVTVSVIVLGNSGLRLWLGPDFAEHSTRVLQWLAAGVFINCLAQVPFALVQSVGRPDLTAKLLLIELPGYLPTLWYLSTRYGIDGAAIAWTARAFIEALVLFVIAKRFLPNGSHPAARVTALMTASLVVFICAAQLRGLIFKGVFLPLTVTVFVLANWFVVFSPQERLLVREWLSSLLSRPMQPINASESK